MEVLTAVLGGANMATQVCTHMHSLTHKHTHSRTQAHTTRTRTHTHTRTHTMVEVQTAVLGGTNMVMHTHAHARTSTHTRARTNTRTQALTHIRIHVRAHTRPFSVIVFKLSCVITPFSYYFSHFPLRCRRGVLGDRDRQMWRSALWPSTSRYIIVTNY